MAWWAERTAIVKTKKVTVMALTVALAMILSFVESQIPAPHSGHSESSQSWCLSFTSSQVPTLETRGQQATSPGFIRPDGFGVILK